MEAKRKTLPIDYARRSVERMIALGVQREHVDDVVRNGVLARAGKSKYKAWIRKKLGLLVVTCALLPDEVRVITVNIGGGKER